MGRCYRRRWSVTRAHNDCLDIFDLVDIRPYRMSSPPRRHHHHHPSPHRLSSIVDNYHRHTLDHHRRIHRRQCTYSVHISRYDTTDRRYIDFRHRTEQPSAAYRCIVDRTSMYSSSDIHLRRIRLLFEDIDCPRLRMCVPVDKCHWCMASRSMVHDTPCRHIDIRSNTLNRCMALVLTVDTSMSNVCIDGRPDIPRRRMESTMWPMTYFWCIDRLCTCIRMSIDRRDMRTMSYAVDIDSSRDDIDIHSDTIPHYMDMVRIVDRDCIAFRRRIDHEYTDANVRRYHSMWLQKKRIIDGYEHELTARLNNDECFDDCYEQSNE